MKILNTASVFRSGAIEKKQFSHQQIPENKTTNSDSLEALTNYNKAFISFRGLNQVLVPPTISGDIASEVLKDQKYRNQLASHIGCKPEDLKPIAGVNELRYVLKNARPSQFDPESASFAINLHNHTKNSDGKLSAGELLTMAADYAATKAQTKPFYIAITNHNETTGIKEALEVVRRNPEKFKDVRIIPGIEFDGEYKNPNIFVDNGPRMDILAHCVDPYEEKFATMVEGIRKDQIDYARLYIEKADQAGLKTTPEQREAIIHWAMHGGLNDIGKNVFKRLIGLLETEANQSGLTAVQLNEIFVDYKAKQPVPTVENIISTASQIDGVNVGLAHPGKIKVYKNLAKGNSTESAITRIISDAKMYGARMIESYYCYEDGFREKYKTKYGCEINEWLEKLARISRENGLLEAGGVDIHGQSFYTRY